MMTDDELNALVKETFRLTRRRYSTDMNAAMRVVEQMRKGGWTMDASNDLDGSFGICFSKGNQPSDPLGCCNEGENQTLARAICIAALRCRGIEVKS